MAIRTAHSGGTTVRWVYGVFIALCAALAVLVHHETTVMSTSPMTGTSSVMSTSSMVGPTQAGHVVSGADTPNAWEPSFPNAYDTCGCDGPGMQHCAAASVATVQLAVPADSESSPFTDLREAAAGRAPAGVVGRAPPDLSVLSQLRI
ncbi:hypothetical protein FNH09_07390 [Streptomyces adustus]|uniref:Uncharacterized protein n=1 Tax=Streptomyces adustus TaxID=1609272 RepID=A0A5N8V8C9_9ACTN|nr:hypothetical protein [Streptomyces adustus]MPY31146.1 hypothetical protein [Streptomyces adustus]